MKVHIKFLIFISIIFLDFVFFSIVNFPVTGAIFVETYLLIFFFKIGSINKKRLYLLLFGIIFLPFLSVLDPSNSGGDFVQFGRTYSLWFASASVIALSCFLPIRKKLSIAHPAISALVVIAVCVIIQSVTSRTGDTTYFNLFGSHQYFGNVDLSTFSIDDRLRAPGFYLEPSFCAYVVSNLCAICLLFEFRSRLAMLLTTVSLIVIQSLTGLIALVFFAAFYASKYKLSFAKMASYMVMAICFSSALIWWFYSDYVTDRLMQFYEIGSSTQYRIAGVIPVLVDVLTSHPFGYFLGSLKEVLPTYMIPHGADIGRSIDNGLYLLVFYFGWFGLFFVVALIYWTMTLLLSARRYEFLTTGVLLLGCFFNGGIFLPEFSLMSLLLIYSFRCSQLIRARADSLRTLQVDAAS